MANAKMVYLHALTPVHAGTGQTVAVIDLPVAREKATGWPVIPSSSVKGVIRDRYAGVSGNTDVDRWFGKIDEAGALCFTDQRLLLFPARSLYGTFAWVTCPLALRRWVRDMKALGVSAPFPGEFAEVAALDILHPAGSTLPHKDFAYLEDLDLRAREDVAASGVASVFAELLFEDEADRNGFVARFALVSDEVFSFLSDTATDVVARVRLDEETKTVKNGQLWYEESVPAEAVFAGAVLVSDHEVRRGGAAAALEKITDGIIQIGGKSTVGRGLCRVVVR